METSLEFVSMIAPPASTFTVRFSCCEISSPASRAFKVPPLKLNFAAAAPLPYLTFLVWSVPPFKLRKLSRPATHLASLQNTTPFAGAETRPFPEIVSVAPAFTPTLRSPFSALNSPPVTRTSTAPPLANSLIRTLPSVFLTSPPLTSK